MENQVLSIEQMNHLKELGVDTSGASMAWQKGLATRHVWVLYAVGNMSLSLPDKERTFTLQDMLSLMPKQLRLKVENYRSPVDCLLMIDVANDCVYYEYFVWQEYSRAKHFDCANLITSAYEMLCWLAEGEYLNKK